MSAQSEPRAAGSEAAAPEHRSTTTLLTDLINQISELFRKEIQLFRAEVNEKTNQAVTAIGLIVAGLVLALVAANALVAALIVGLAELGIGETWATLIVGIAIALIGYGLVNSGVQSLKASSLAPERTARSVKQDATVVKDRVI